MSEVNTTIDNAAPVEPAVEEPKEGVTTDTEPERADGPERADEPAAAEESSESEPEIDYARMMEDDLRTLKASFPELAELGSIAELSGAMRYAALRDMGLDAVEAYMASSAPRRSRDSRSHLSSAVPKGASAPRGTMTKEELATARELFRGMSDTEIRSLYKRVSE